MAVEVRIVGSAEAAKVADLVGGVKAEERVVALRAAAKEEAESAGAKGLVVVAVDLVETGTGAGTGAAEKEVEIAVEATVEAMGVEETAVGIVCRTQHAHRTPLQLELRETSSPQRVRWTTQTLPKLWRSPC